MKMINEHFRMTKEQDEHLNTLAAQLGYGKSQLLRMIVDNADPVTLKTMDDSRRLTDMKLIATRKYLMSQLRGLTTNVNQIARGANAIKKDGIVNDAIATTLMQTTNLLTKQVKELRDEIDEYCEGDK